MILIADGGSTKSAWCQIDNTGHKTNFNTEGYNPYFVDTKTIISSLERELPEALDKQAVKKVYYYGAGCSVPEKVETVYKAMKAIFINADVFVGHDLLAAARALMGNEPGFAAILGTGTNSCLYDGKDVTLNIDSLGYFLGDEGSGSFIGKQLLRDYMRGYMPKELQEAFFKQYGLSNEDIFDNIYNKPLPNRFLASFSKFAYDHNASSYSRGVVKSAFQYFFRNLVCHYPNYQTYTFNCVGSVGYNFRDILEEVCNENKMQFGKIIRAPIDDLVDFHTAVAI